MHLPARRIGLIDALDESCRLVKVHRPYHESDHVLNIAYNILCGGTCLEDIELRRNDEAYLDDLGAVSIPDPNTEGDFWTGSGAAIPLVVSLANTVEPLHLINSGGNRPSHEGAAASFDSATALCTEAWFRAIILRGDTDFGQAMFLDVPRHGPENIKERIVEDRGFGNIRLDFEEVIDFACRPTSCAQDHRVVAIHKNLSVASGPMCSSTTSATLLHVPCQVIRAGRRIGFRLLARNQWRNALLRVVAALRSPLHC